MKNELELKERASLIQLENIDLIKIETEKAELILQEEIKEMKAQIQAIEVKLNNIDWNKITRK